ncbi:ATP-binding protein [Streptomyces sp. ADI96-02]|uniref:ATP-binding protein n=1 Tax=Streptomyces sp. ADI96-02 TaxID=1522760 RepID=UPI001F152C2B|nr:ATP-binding protein [Streptomyces sp. ADI96-02]
MPAACRFGPDGEGLAFLARQFASTPRGARMARRAAVREVGRWGFGPMTDASCAVALVVAELAANAACHGRVRGRNFHLRLEFDASSGRVRVEVSDALLVGPPLDPGLPPDGRESGRGLFLVDVVALRWGWTPRKPIGKTVWAEVAVGRPDRA